jgi:hypothetical protein
MKLYQTDTTIICADNLAIYLKVMVLLTEAKWFQTVHVLKTATQCLVPKKTMANTRLRPREKVLWNTKI